MCVVLHDLGPGTLARGSKGMKKRQTQGYTHSKAGVLWPGLSEGGTVASWNLSVFVMYG